MLATLLIPATAAGHSLSAKVFMREGSVRVEAQYSDASPASHATVKVYAYSPGQPNSEQSLLLEGELDREGKCAFVPQTAQDLYFVIDDNAGHRAEVQVLAESLRPLFDKDRDKDQDKDSVGAADPIGVSPGPLLLDGVPLWGKLLIGVGAILCLGFVVSRAVRSRKAG